MEHHSGIFQPFIFGVDIGDIEANVSNPVVADRSHRFSGFGLRTGVLKDLDARVPSLEHRETRG
jgi:hypothetical protein